MNVIDIGNTRVNYLPFLRLDAAVTSKYEHSVLFTYEAGTSIMVARLVDCIMFCNHGVL